MRGDSRNADRYRALMSDELYEEPIPLGKEHLGLRIP